MQFDPNFKQALRISYQLLSYRPRSTFEIRTKLKGKGYNSEVIEKVIEHLKRLHYLNDREFAKYWIETRMRVKPVGSLILRKDLKEKGLEEELVEKAIKEEGTGCDEYNAALKVAKKRLYTYGKIHKLKAKKRIYDFLIRRGFDFYTVRQILKELF